MRVKVVPVVIGALRTVPLRLKVSLKALGVDASTSLIQKSALFHGVGKNAEEGIRDVKLKMRRISMDVSWLPLATCCCSGPMYHQLQHLKLCDLSLKSF